MADPASLAPTVLGGLIAAGIVLAALILALGASTLFVRRFRQSSAADDEDDGRVTSVAITTALGLGLTAALVLVPMDVFLVSAVNDRAVGVRHEWADDAFVRWAQALYGLIIVWLLAVLPFAVFWRLTGDDYERTWRSRQLGALRNTVLFMMLTGALIAAGSYFTFQVPTEATTSSNMATALNDINHIVAERPQTPFGHALTFLVVLFCTIGLLVHITYTGYGLAHVPLDLLLNNSRTSTRRSAITTSTSSLLNRGSRRSITTMNMDDVRTELQITREKRRALAAKNATSRDVVGERPNMQHVLVDRKLARALEMEEQALLRRAHSLGDLRRQHWMRRLFKWLVKTLEPFTVAFGVISMVVAVAIVSSVVFAGIDRVTKSTPLCSGKCGTFLLASHLPNPVDSTFAWLSSAFPTDFTLLIIGVLFIIATFLSGMVHLGVRIAWIKIWPIEKRRTKSQALLVVSWMLLVSVLALNVMLYQMAPQYMAFGSQQYCNQTASAAGDRAGMPLWKPCTANSPQLVQCHWTMDSESAAAHLCTPTVLARMYLHISAGHHYLLHLPFTIGQWMLSMAFGFTLVWQTLSKCGNGTREKNRGRAYSVDGDDNGEDGDGYHDVQEEDLAEGASRRASRTLRVGGRIWKDGRWQDVSPSGAASEEGERRGSWLGSLPKAPRESHEYLLRKDGDGLSKGVPKPARTAQHSAIRQSATAAADQSENEEGVVAQESNWWGRLLQKH